MTDFVFKLHRMQTIVIDVCGVCLSVCVRQSQMHRLTLTRLSCAVQSVVARAVYAACRVCGSFSAVFAKYLWPLVVLSVC